MPWVSSPNRGCRPPCHGAGATVYVVHAVQRGHNVAMREATYCVYVAQTRDNEVGRGSVRRAWLDNSLPLQKFTLATRQPDGRRAW